MTLFAYLYIKEFIRLGFHREYLICEKKKKNKKINNINLFY